MGPNFDLAFKDIVPLGFGAVSYWSPLSWP